MDGTLNTKKKWVNSNKNNSFFTPQHLREINLMHGYKVNKAFYQFKKDYCPSIWGFKPLVGANIIMY